jgi:hypothetical protein
MRSFVITRFIRVAILGSTLLNLQLRAEVPIEIYKTRTCGCCGKWVEHLKANGFNPNVIEVPSTAEYRKKFGVPDKLQSCHTAVVGGYTVEGHVQNVHGAVIVVGPCEGQKPSSPSLNTVPGKPARRFTTAASVGESMAPGTAISTGHSRPRISRYGP